MLPLSPDNEVRRLRLQESIDQDRERAIEPGVPWNNKERRAVYNLNYRQTHREEIRVRNQAWRQAHLKQRKVTNSVWRQAHRERLLAKGLAYNAAMKVEALQVLGSKCACPGCEVSEPAFLTIDHINGRPKGRRKNALQEASSSGWDKAKFQILCANCNFAKRDRGFCPVHQKPPSKEVTQ